VLGVLIVRRLPRIGVGVALCVVLLAPGAAAQQNGPWDFRAPRISRPQLEEVLARYEAAAQSAVYSVRLRAEARGKADSIRARLKDGDMRVGDRLRLTVADQRQLSDTFIVSAGPAVVLPVIGSVALGGALRSELEARVASSVDRVYRGATVQVALLTRVAVMGGVGRPGYYALPSDALVPDAISAAGGLAPDARLTDIYVERGLGRVWEPESLQVAMRDGRTIDDLGLQSGDRIVVPLPAALSRNPAGVLQVLPYLISLPLTLVSLVQLLK
jgi:protein involved in polysaccharide export with SLBB domain